jgi:hypothetical protein
MQLTLDTDLVGSFKVEVDICEICNALIVKSQNGNYMGKHMSSVHPKTAAPTPEPQEDFTSCCAPKVSTEGIGLQEDRVEVAKVLCDIFYPGIWEDMTKPRQKDYLTFADQILAALRKEPAKPDTCTMTNASCYRSLCHLCPYLKPEKPAGDKWLVKAPNNLPHIDYAHYYQAGAKAQLISDAKRLREEPYKIGLTAVMESLQKEVAGLVGE